MPRLLREQILVPDQPNHIVLRGNNRRTLFSYPRDRDHFAWFMNRASKRTGCAISNLSLLTNHVHVALTPPSLRAASDCIKLATQRYAQYRNAQRSGTGKLFESRFWSKPIRSDRHLAVCSAYIDLNPSRAGMSPANQRWSTLGHHIGEAARTRIPPDLWTPSDWFRSLGRTDEERFSRYREWIADYLAYHDEYDAEFGCPAFEPAHTLRLVRPDGSSAR